MSSGDVAGRAARGAAAHILRNGGVQVMQIASSLVVARLLVPAEYGTFAIAAVLVGFARMAGDLGFSASMTVAPTIERRDLQGATFIGVTAAVIAAVAIGVAGYFMNAASPSVLGHLVTAILAISLVIDAMRLGPTVVLSRGLLFQRVALVAIVETFALYLVQIGLLIAGAGVWALVIGQIARSIVGAGVLARLGSGFVRPKRVPAMRSRIRTSLPYQGPAILSGLSGLVLPLIIVAQLGKTGVGLWAWATVLSAPFTAIFIGIHQISMASFARLRREVINKANVAELLVARLTLLTAAVAAGGLYGLAPSIVTFIFGERWEPAVGAVQANLVGLVPFALVYVLAASLDARMQPRRRLIAALIGTACAIAAVLPLSLTLGVTGAAIAGAIVAPLVDALILVGLARVLVARAITGAIVVLAGAGLVSTAMETTVQSWQTLVLALSVSILAASVLALCVDRHAVQQAARYLRRRRAADAPSAELGTGPVTS
jgi:PST family polysaccharide transporter